MAERPNTTPERDDIAGALDVVAGTCRPTTHDPASDTRAGRHHIDIDIEHVATLTFWLNEVERPTRASPR